MELQQEGQEILVQGERGVRRASVRKGIGASTGWPWASLPPSERVSWVFVQNPSRFTFQMGLFRVPEFASHFYFKLLQNIKRSIVIFLLHLTLWSLGLFLFSLLSKNIEEDRGVLTEPQWGTRLGSLWGTTGLSWPAWSNGTECGGVLSVSLWGRPRQAWEENSGSLSPV